MKTLIFTLTALFFSNAAFSSDLVTQCRARDYNIWKGLGQSSTVRGERCVTYKRISPGEAQIQSVTDAYNGKKATVNLDYDEREFNQECQGLGFKKARLESISRGYYSHHKGALDHTLSPFWVKDFHSITLKNDFIESVVTAVHFFCVK